MMDQLQTGAYAVNLIGMVVTLGAALLHHGDIAVIALGIQVLALAVQIVTLVAYIIWERFA